MSISAKSLISGPAVEYPDDMPTSLSDYIQSLVLLYPDGKYTEIDKAGQEQTLTYAQAHRQAQNIGSALNVKDLKAGTEIILCFDSVLDFIPSAWACIMAGYTWVPWSTVELARNPKGFAVGFQALLNKLNTPWILASTEIAGGLRQNYADINVSQIIDIYSLKYTESFIDKESFYEDSSEQGEALITTSGATGSPKLACIDNSTLLNRFYKKKPNKLNILYCFPLHSISGVAVLFPQGSHSIYLHPNRFASHPQEVFLTLDHFDIQWFGLSSYMASMLIDAIDRNTVRNNLSSLQGLTFGADFIVPQVVENLILRFQDLTANNLCISFVYGMTECGPICRAEFSAKDLLNSLKNNSAPLLEIGKCTPGWSLKIVDDDSRVVAEGQIGNIYVKSKDYMFAGYRGDTELSKKHISSDGWFKSGDIGVINDGKLTLTGRDHTKFKINGKSFSLQQLEAPLRSLPGLREAMVFAGSVLTDKSISEELAIFFVPEAFEDSLLNDLSMQIIREVAKNTHINVKHLIAIDTNEIERTATGKIQRHLMVEKYLRGQWQNLMPSYFSSNKQKNIELQAYLLVLWKDILKLETLPPMDQDFFFLGGDSLAAAILITELEKKFNCPLSLDLFYKNPTINTLAGLLQIIDGTAAVTLIGDNSKLSTDSETSHSHIDLLHKIKSYVDSWQGSRQFEGSLLVGMNTQGRKRPIIWVFQSYQELQVLADELGPNQPLYGLRSCVTIMPIKDYTEAKLQALINRYLWEILALAVEHPVILAGNCQGGIIALALARMLKKIGKVPASLILMEWMYSYGKYTDPVLFLFGEMSHTSVIYSRPETANIDWKSDFPDHQVTAISGAHGDYFKQENIHSLAFILDRYSLIL